MTEQGPTPFVVLGVTGGIAAYKAVELCRQLIDAGLHVAPVLTKDATRFVTPLTFSALASEPAQTELYDASSAIPHTRLGQAAALIVVAPATANLLARYAHGLADDLLTDTLLASRAPVLVAPAMHTEMWEQPSVQANVALLRARGVHVVGPAGGRLAGGDVGLGRMEEPARIVEVALTLLGRGGAGDLSGRSVVISAGGTREVVDPVRVLTNRSSGKQGGALAEAALARGAAVTLVTTMELPGVFEAQPALTVLRVESAAQMHEAMLRESKEADVVVMAAAVADYRPAEPMVQKLKREHGELMLRLEPTEDILAALVAQRPPGQIVVGFAAETDQVLEHARAKLAKKGCDLLVVNDVSAPGVGFDHDTNAVTILGSDGSDSVLELASKRSIADSIFDRVVCSLDALQGETSP
jgi:phosphopantothenoylcysteine decarboxylase/phosphopantothenate--cysteine ligase